MTENKFDMAVITAVDGEGCLACSWDERDLESEEIDLEDGEKIPAMLYEKEVVFNLITAVLSDMVKRDEGLFLSVVENLKEKVLKFWTLVILAFPRRVKGYLQFQFWGAKRLTLRD